MAGRLAGKVALITGGGSGIGRACAVRFAEEGANVCVADRDAARAAETARQVEGKGRKAFSLAVDTTDEAANDAMVARCVETLGGVDVLVAAAGVPSPRRQGTGSDQPYTILEIPTEAFRARDRRQPLRRPLFEPRGRPLDGRQHRRGGSIVNLGSIMSKMPSSGGAYSVSKAGVWMLTKCLAQELATQGIRVNAIGPGFIETPMTAPLRGMPPAPAGR